MTTRTPSRPRGLLTPRQREVLTLLHQGLRPQAIAQELGLTIGSVRTMLRDTYRRLGASGAYQALCLAREQGLFAPTERTRR